MEHSLLSLERILYARFLIVNIQIHDQMILHTEMNRRTENKIYFYFFSIENWVHFLLYRIVMLYEQIESYFIIDHEISCTS